MTDEEFLSLKRQILEVGDMCYKINYHYRELRKDISELDDSLSELTSDFFKLKSDLNNLHNYSKKIKK